jgi:hypothetical protein
MTTREKYWYEHHNRRGKYLFGWKNIRWFIVQLVLLYSEQPSFFSKKRIESGIAFVIGQMGMLIFFFHKYPGLSMTDFLMWAGVEFTIAGYITYQIQKQQNAAGVVDQNLDVTTTTTLDPNTCQVCGTPRPPAAGSGGVVQDPSDIPASGGPSDFQNGQ